MTLIPVDLYIKSNGVRYFHMALKDNEEVENDFRGNLKEDRRVLKNRDVLSDILLQEGIEHSINNPEA